MPKSALVSWSQKGWFNIPTKLSYRFFLYIYYTFIPLYASALNVSSALYAVHVYKKY